MNSCEKYTHEFAQWLSFSCGWLLEIPQMLLNFRQNLTAQTEAHLDKPFWLTTLISVEKLQDWTDDPKMRFCFPRNYLWLLRKWMFGCWRQKCCSPASCLMPGAWPSPAFENPLKPTRAGGAWDLWISRSPGHRQPSVCIWFIGLALQREGPSLRWPLGQILAGNWDPLMNPARHSLNIPCGNLACFTRGHI